MTEEMGKGETVNELALFAGAGGGILGGHLLGWRTVCAVEFDPYAASVLVARQNDRILPPFPIWDDVRTFDGLPWRGRVDVVSGGFPCQDISLAGKGEGITGTRSGLWGEMARIIGEVLPGFVFVENSPALVGRGLAVVLGDLASMGYDAQWGVVGADDAEAPHQRKRIWILAHANAKRLSRSGIPEVGREILLYASGGSWGDEALAADSRGEANKDMANSDMPRREEQRSSIATGEKYATAECGGWWSSEPDLGRVAHGVAARVDRLKAIGNGQVPAVAELAWKTLTA